MNKRDFEQIVTGRSESFIKDDMLANTSMLQQAIKGSRIAIVGAAGSIGTAVVRTILRFKPAALSLLDLSENNLVEVVRELRSSADVTWPEDFDSLPIGIGSMEFERYFKETKPFDYFFNLSAIKHVRSEKSIYCLMRMIDTNILFLHDFLTQNAYRFRHVFSVSSDKAANPANLMGASKMVMEEVLLAHAAKQPFTTARMVNVAFSDGSLPYGFLQRIEKQQPLSAPHDVKRYFMSHQEAGDLCVLAGTLGENRDVFFPTLNGGRDEETFSQIAVDLLEFLGYEPVICETEEEAKGRVSELIPRKQWPCYFFESDTTGEKRYEEFYTHHEQVDRERFKYVGVVHRGSVYESESLYAFLDFCRTAKYDPFVTKEDYVEAMLKVVPTLQHIETGKNLDHKM